MGGSIHKEEKTYCENSACEIMRKLDPAHVKYCEKWGKMTKNLEKQFPESGTFNIEVLDSVKDKIISLTGSFRRKRHLQHLSKWYEQACRYKIANKEDYTTKLPRHQPNTHCTQTPPTPPNPPAYCPLYPHLSEHQWEEDMQVAAIIASTTRPQIQHQDQDQGAAGIAGSSHEGVEYATSRVDTHESMATKVELQGIASLADTAFIEQMNSSESSEEEPPTKIEKRGRPTVRGEKGVYRGRSLVDLRSDSMERKFADYLARTSGISVRPKSRVSTKPPVNYTPAQTRAKAAQVRRKEEQHGRPDTRIASSQPQPHKINPVRVFTIPGDGGNNDRTVPLWSPWRQTDLHAIVKEFPDPKKNLMQCCKYLSTIAALHEPTERDWRQLIMALWPEEKIDYKKIVSAEITTTQLSREEQDEIVKKFQTELRLTFPQQVDWSKLYTTKQEMTESVAEYQKRLLDNIKEHAGFTDLEADQVKPMIKGLFMDGLTEQIKDRVTIQHPEWRAQDLSVLLESAKRHEKNIFQKKNKAKEKLLTLQIKTLKGEAQKQFKPVEKFSLPAKQNMYPKQSFSAPSQGNDFVCYACGMTGHFQRNCPTNLSRVQRNPQLNHFQYQRRSGRRPYNLNRGHYQSVNPNARPFIPNHGPRTMPQSQPYFVPTGQEFGGQL